MVKTKGGGARGEVTRLPGAAVVPVLQSLSQESLVAAPCLLGAERVPLGDRNPLPGLLNGATPQSPHLVGGLEGV